MVAPAIKEPVMPSRETGFEARLIRIVGSGWFWAGLVTLIATLSIGQAVLREPAKLPPIIFDLPAFTLTDQLDKPFGSSDLKDKVWVADFIFTSCPTRCPQLTEAMAKLQKRLRNMGDAVMLVSFSVDPERDTPQKLAEYARKHQANPRRWRFLTGELSAIEKAVVEGFKMPLDPGQRAEDGSLFDITHGTRFVLVDQQSRVRGFYEVDDASLNQLMADLTILVHVRPEEPTTPPRN